MWNRFAYKAEDINDLLSLQLAALQMLQTKHSFSASGFFPMDMTVLHMVNNKQKDQDVLIYLSVLTANGIAHYISGVFNTNTRIEIKGHYSVMHTTK